MSPTLKRYLPDGTAGPWWMLAASLYVLANILPFGFSYRLILLPVAVLWAVASIEALRRVRVFRTLGAFGKALILVAFYVFTSVFLQDLWRHEAGPILPSRYLPALLIGGGGFLSTFLWYRWRDDRHQAVTPRAGEPSTAGAGGNGRRDPNC